MGFVGVLGKVDGSVTIEIVSEAVNVAGESDYHCCRRAQGSVFSVSGPYVATAREIVTMNSAYSSLMLATRAS